ncbi:MAG: SDR family oxidoreductase [Rhodanobacter sp.]|nr:MAG: SDR family oxidoreductase [Rhodanobacter sp.]
MKLDLDGKVAVVTGGSSGIGLATVSLLLEAGACVAFCARDEERLHAAEAMLIKQYPAERILAAQGDVLSANAMSTFAAAVEARFGPADMLVNNAGQGRVSTFSDTDDDAWHTELELKLFGVIRPTRAFLPQLERSTSGAIVCVNSLLALQPEPHMVCTSAARAGLLNLTHSLATELAPKGIRVNSILVGLVESGQWRRRFAAREDQSLSWEQWSAALASKKSISLGRLGKPEEAARAIFFLATELSSFTTGSHIDVSGGLARHV